MNYLSYLSMLQKLLYFYAYVFKEKMLNMHWCLFQEYSSCGSDSQNQQLSQASEATVCGLGRLEALNSFLSLSNMSPVKEKRIPYMKSSEKTKSKCVTKVLQCIAAICETICPSEGQVLQENVMTLISKEVRDTEI